MSSELGTTEYCAKTFYRLGWTALVFNTICISVAYLTTYEIIPGSVLPHMIMDVPWLVVAYVLSGILWPISVTMAGLAWRGRVIRNLVGATVGLCIGHLLCFVLAMNLVHRDAGGSFDWWPYSC
jgi:hypothetical protein